MSSTQHQLIEQCATRLRGIVEALDNIHDTSPQRWSTDLDDVHSSAESLLALINDQAPPSDAERWKEQFACMQLQRDHHRESADAALARVAELTATRNRYGVDAHYFNKNLQRILRDFESFTPDELARSLIILAKVADEKVVAQHSVPELDQSRSALTEAQMRRIYENSTEAENERLGFAAFARLMRRAEAVHQIAAAPGKEVPQAWLDVQAERRRQIEAEGWTPEHDDAHSHGQMARAAACYALAGSSAPNDGTAALLVSLAWPWDQQWWKPTTPRRDLVKACALALAEIERLDRVAASQGGPSDA
ncbi:TPA: hypothetical protein ACNIB5_005081 [Pseudomonas aeruginosa]|uniref:hypothetical protein n=1 Tax=Pseudomonas aeruginosa TaxID=287 RepID=UPI00053D911F|nr:hypothetical protein [Pseudomonas aeruginosa]